MTEVDTSSYPKPQQSNFLDTAQKFQGLEQGSLAINQAKLNQANQALGYMTRAMSSLGPNASADQYLAVGQNAVKMGLVPPQMLQTYVDRLNQYKKPDGTFDSKDFYNEFVTAAATHQETINYHLGQPGTFSNGQQTTPVVQSPKFGLRATGLPIQNQPPPQTPIIDTNPTNPDGTPNPNYNRPTMLGPRTPIAPPGVATGPGQPPQLPVSNGPAPKVQTLPVGPVTNPKVLGESSNFGGNVTGVDVGQPTPTKVVENRFAMPSTFATGQAPGYEEGLKKYNEDQTRAGTLMQAAKPAIQALPLMQAPGFLSGPLTDQFTKIVAGLKSTGLIDIKDTNDPTAIRQEVVKKLNQYVSSSPVGQRSDAAQTLKEASSPSPNVQILPALIKLTKDAIALDRVQAAMPNAFQGKDYQNYTKHQGTFPQSVDERAFTLDLESPDDKNKLVQQMAKKEKSSNARDRKEATKFFNSLRIADQSGFYQ